MILLQNYAILHSIELSDWRHFHGDYDKRTSRQATGSDARRTSELCRNGQIVDVYRIGTSWVMPTDTQKPNDARAIRRTRIKKQLG